MRLPLATSLAVHVIILTISLLSISSNKKLEAGGETLPVEFVSVEEMTQIQQGDKKAAKAEKSAPAPTQKASIDENAQNIGDNNTDANTPPKPSEKPAPVKTVSAPKSAQKSIEDTKEQEKTEVKKQAEQLAKAQEAAKAAEQKEKQEKIEAEALEKAKAEEKEAEEAKQAAEKALKEKEAEDKAAKQAEEAKQAAKAAQAVKEAAAKKAKEKAADDKLADDIAALLNKAEGSSGGKKKSTQAAALGGEKATQGAKLSLSEMDALRGSIQKCFSSTAGINDVGSSIVKVRFNLNQAGEVDGGAKITSKGGGSGAEVAAAEALRRAVMKCQPYNLPKDKYENWSEVEVSFDLQQLSQ